MCRKSRCSRTCCGSRNRCAWPVSADSKDYDFDLRKPGDLARSQLLHRLRLLGIPWGELTEALVRSQGTFREAWSLQWRPEFAVALIEASVWGNTVESAATARAMGLAGEARQLGELTRLIDTVLLADLPEAAAHVMARLEAEAMLGRLLAVDGALRTLENSEHLAQWRGALARLAERDCLHGLLAGRVCRIQLECGAMDAGAAERRMGLALSRGADPLQGAAWLEGFLRGSGMLLLHTEALWAILDGWVCSFNEESFTERLPLLRRTFASFPAPERRMMGERVKRDDGAGAARWRRHRHQPRHRLLPGTDPATAQHDPGLDLGFV